MFVAGAVCPHPPLLVPEVASGARAELDPLRAACDEAVRALLAAAPDRVVVIGASVSTGTVTGMLDLHVYGLRSAGERSPAGRLPLSLGMGDWLLRRAGWDGAVVFFGVSDADSPQACEALGKSLAARDGRVAVLAMGDACSCRPPVAPLPPDERAVDFDASVAAALRAGDRGALLAIDEATATALGVAGRASWQVLAGAAPSVRGKLLHDEAPYGVGYLVASWTPAP